MNQQKPMHEKYMRHNLTYKTEKESDEPKPKKKTLLKSDSHVSEKFCQIKIFPSVVRKNPIICLSGV